MLAIKDQVEMNGEPQIVYITREHLRASGRRTYRVEKRTIKEKGLQ